MSDETKISRFLTHAETYAKAREARADELANDEQRNLKIREKLATIKEEDLADRPAQKAVIDIAITCLRERAETLSIRDQYHEASDFLRRIGYTVPARAMDSSHHLVDVIIHAFNHCDVVQDRFRAALKHQGVSETWCERIEKGHMQEFFDEYSSALQRDYDAVRQANEQRPKPDWYSPARNVVERALEDLRGATAEVKGKLCEALDLEPDASWIAIVDIVRDLRNRVQYWQEAQQSALQEHEKSLERMRGEARALKEDLCLSLGLEPDPDVSWSVILKAMQETSAKLRDRDEDVREPEVFILALNVVREQIIEADRLIHAALGTTPSPQQHAGITAGALVRNVSRLICCMEEDSLDHERDKEKWEDEKGALNAKIENLDDEVRRFQNDDKTKASEWKNHYWNLAALLETPRSLMGPPELPNVDQTTKYVTQVLAPLRNLQDRVEELEQVAPHPESHDESSQEVEPLMETGASISVSVKCQHCGQDRPMLSQFCPSCAKE